MRALGGILFLCFVVCFPRQATAETPAFNNFVETEKRVFRHETSLSKMAVGLENWLSGREKQIVLLKALNEVAAETKQPIGLPRTYGDTVASAEKSMVKMAQDFANSERPDSDGQRALFTGMSEQTQQRTLALLKWREASVGKLRKSSIDSGPRALLEWEAAWYPLWADEAKFTRRLQAGLLQDSTQDDADILKGLLALRIRAQGIEPPQQASGLHEKSLERLTILARTAEQLLRLEKRKSRGALTRVRRLSRKLTSITKQFQEERLQLLTSSR